MKKITSLLLVLSMLLCTFVMSACGSNNSNGTTNSDGTANSNTAQNKTQKEEEFYNLVDETKELLDTVADDIYSYWYDCIYEDKYLDNINYAIACAKNDNKDNLDTIEANTEKIKTLYKGVKDGKLSAEIKAVMQAYNDYYTLVVEISGSFNSYSASKETCKKELASALDDLSFELD